MTADWVERQVARRGLRDPRLLAAMRSVPRELFVPGELRRHARDDSALPIGYGQTISQPYIVALICGALDLRGDERVLDVGTGSGYQAAVLARLAGEVISIERIPELAEAAAKRLAAFGVAVDVLVGDGTLGVPDRAPFDGIAVAASATEIPHALYEQLGGGGTLVLPLGDELVSVRKGAGGPVVRSLVPARFVPLREGTSSPVR